MRTIPIAAIALLILGVHAVAQFPQFVVPPGLPEGDGAWTMHISSTGGFTGRGLGSVTVTSLGVRTCDLPATTCSTPLSDEKFGPLKQFATSFDATKWVNLSPFGLINVCSDCFITTVTFTRRESGQVKPYTFSWTVANQSSVPPDLVRIADIALSGNL
jgi:hypothetical protein